MNINYPSLGWLMTRYHIGGALPEVNVNIKRDRDELILAGMIFYSGGEDIHILFSLS